MLITQKIIDDIQVAMQHTKMNGEINWKEWYDCDHMKYLNNNNTV